MPDCSPLEDDRHIDEQFPLDIFLSESSGGEAVARPLGEWLRKDGLKPRFDEGVIRGHNTYF
jgi:hypothetical protein